MAETKDITSSLLFKIVIILTSMAMVNDMIIYPTAAPIFMEYGETTSEVILNGIITGPGLACIVGSLLMGFLAYRVGKKILVAISYAVFVCSTIPNAFITDPYMILTLRMISGLCMGAVSTLGAALVADFFVEEKEQSRMMGFYMATMGVLGIIVGQVSGILAVENWHNVFWLYLIAVPILAGIVWVVPNRKPPAREEAVEDEVPTDDAVVTPWGKILAATAACFVANLFFSSFFTFNGIFVEEQGLGDPAVAGTITSLISLGSLVANLLFGMIFMKTQRSMPVIFAAVFGIGHIILGITLNLPLIYVVAAILGAMYGLCYTYYLTYMAVVVPPKSQTLALGLVNSAVSFAMFLGPYVGPTAASVIGGTLLAQGYLVIGVGFLIFAVISAVLCVVYYKKHHTMKLAEE